MTPLTPAPVPLQQAAPRDPDRYRAPAAPPAGAPAPDAPVLVVLAAGKGSRFGAAPKCIQRVHGTPLARHTLDAFRRVHGAAAAAVCVVGYRHDEVAAALGPDNAYIVSANPVGGTAYAAWEALGAPGLIEGNRLLVITMGDRIVTPAVFRRLEETHRAGAREADLTCLTARYEPPRHRGRGRVVRDAAGRVARIVEQRDIDTIADGEARARLEDLTEGNCPLYGVRAAVLQRHLAALTNGNAQAQYYLTDIVAALHDAWGDIRTVTTTVDDPDYDLLCADVTRPADLALLDGVLAARRERLAPAQSEIEAAAARLADGRPAGQRASIARQLEELRQAIVREKLAFAPEAPVAIGVSGGRLRIAFMHPDMVRFFGPAWQMPIGAADEAGDAQIVLLAQASDDRRILIHPTNSRYRETVNALPSDDDRMYPGGEVADWHSYEAFGTRMSEHLLLALGYFAEEELARRRERGQPLPPPALWVANAMRRPFSLVGNAIASLRTLRTGALGARVQRVLGRDVFTGLRLVAAGGIPQGGFSSSSALTLATKNALNALYDLGVPPDLLVHLAAQAEYGTGVRAGSLDQATEQKGRTGQGTLISSNPRDNYRVLGTYAVPADRIRILFPYSVARDRDAWRWSWGAYAEQAGAGPLTAGEMRKLTGKAAELAALLVRLPLDTDFFQVIEEDLLADGELEPERRAWVAGVLRRLPLLATQADLRGRAAEARGWLIGQLAAAGRVPAQEASQKADALLAGLFAGWRDPRLRRMRSDGKVVEELGVPLRAIVAYLFAEVARNFHLLHHPEAWIEDVRRSQAGDRGFTIDPARLPPAASLAEEQPWERGCAGPERLARWLEQAGAVPVDYNRGLDDDALAPGAEPDFARIEGASFFRGLALIDLAEAMLRRVFGDDAVAVRVNAAGQGDFFQVHVDTGRADVEAVKAFLRAAFFSRFGLVADPDIVEVHPGGGAVGVRLSRLEYLPRLIEHLRAVPD